MVSNLITAVARCLCVVTLSLGASAWAQDLPAPSNGLELGATLGYAQGLGPVGAGVPRLQDLGGPGGAFQLDVGWRITPRWLVGAYGELGLFSEGDLPGSDHALSIAAGLQGQYHFLPEARLDPWVSLGLGWRGYWADRDGETHGLKGFDLARLRIGLDYRVSSTLAFGPVVGIALTQFLDEEPPGVDGYRDVNDKELDTFVFVGAGGRFDL